MNPGFIDCRKALGYIVFEILALYIVANRPVRCDMKEVESNWLATQPRLREKYKGEYIAISGERIVAHGKILKDVIAEARKIDPDPLICKIPTQDILIA